MKSCWRHRSPYTVRLRGRGLAVLSQNARRHDGTAGPPTYRTKYHIPRYSILAYTHHTSEVTGISRGRHVLLLVAVVVIVTVTITIGGLGVPRRREHEFRVVVLKHNRASEVGAASGAEVDDLVLILTESLVD